MAMDLIDLGPSTRALSELVGRVGDGVLGAPTPCPDYTVGDLVEHIGGLTTAFTMAARKDTAAAGPPRPGDASRLEPGWRQRIGADLVELAEAWRDPAAWTGMTQAGGVHLPGEVAGLVALDELVVHGWDLARATGQPFEPGDPTLHAVHGFVAQFCGPGSEQQREGLFGPEVATPPDAPLLDRVIGMTGRDPGWRPAG
jgi:uncharacterized protein (TIGR03086 family)